VHELTPIAGERGAGFLRLAATETGALALWTEPGTTPRVHLVRIHAR
jgi:hypothetical protein